MNTKDNLTAVRRFCEGFNTHNLDIWDEVCTPDFINHDPGLPAPEADLDQYREFAMSKRNVRCLSYVGLVLVIDNATQERHWASTAIFVPHYMIFGAGPTPNVALESLVDTAIGEDLSLPVAASVHLDALAGDLLQLAIRRSDSSASAACEWTGTGRFRRRWLLERPRTIVVTASQPDEVLAEFALQTKCHARR